MTREAAQKVASGLGDLVELPPLLDDADLGLVDLLRGQCGWSAKGQQSGAERGEQQSGEQQSDEQQSGEQQQQSGEQQQSGGAERAELDANGGSCVRSMRAQAVRACEEGVRACCLPRR